MTNKMYNYCHGTTKKGDKCTKIIDKNKEYCHLHQSQKGKIIYQNEWVDIEIIYCEDIIYNVIFNSDFPLLIKFTKTSKKIRDYIFNKFPWEKKLKLRFPDKIQHFSLKNILSSEQMIAYREIYDISYVEKYDMDHVYGNFELKSFKNYIKAHNVCFEARCATNLIKLGRDFLGEIPCSLIFLKDRKHIIMSYNPNDLEEIRSLKEFVMNEKYFVRLYYKKDRFMLGILGNIDKCEIGDKFVLTSGQYKISSKCVTAILISIFYYIPQVRHSFINNIPKKYIKMWENAKEKHGYFRQSYGCNVTEFL